MSQLILLLFIFPVSWQIFLQLFLWFWILIQLWTSFSTCLLLLLRRCASFSPSEEKTWHLILMLYLDCGHPNCTPPCKLWQHSRVLVSLYSSSCLKGIHPLIEPPPPTAAQPLLIMFQTDQYSLRTMWTKCDQVCMFRSSEFMNTCKQFINIFFIFYI